MEFFIWSFPWYDKWFIEPRMLLFLYCNTCNVGFGFSVDKLVLSRPDTTYIRIQVEVSEYKSCFGKRYFRVVDITVSGTINFCFAFLASWYKLWLSMKVYEDAKTCKIFVLCVYHFLIQKHDVPPLNFQSYRVLRLSKEDSRQWLTNL